MFGKRKTPPAGVSPFLPPPPRFVSPERKPTPAPAPPVERRKFDLPTPAAHTDDAVKPLVAIVLMDGPSAPSVDRVIEQARKMWPAMPTLSVQHRGDGTPVIVDNAGTICGTTMFVPVPYPISALSEAIETTIGWQAVEHDVQHHRTHAVVSVTHADPARAHMLLTYLVAATVEDVDAIGVYWSNTNNLIATETFLGHARRSDAPPALLWIKVATREAPTATGEVGVLAYTQGLSSIGLKDYECVCSREDLEAFVLDFLYERADGAVIRGGQEPDGVLREFTVLEGTRPYAATFRHVVSIRDHGADVIVAHLQRA